MILRWEPVLSRPELLAAPVRSALEGRQQLTAADGSPFNVGQVEVAQIDPDDVNRAIRRRLDVRKCSFTAMEEAVERTGTDYGGITPIGLPTDWPVLVDARVLDRDQIIIGSGLRRSKLRLPRAAAAHLPGAQVVPGLALEV